MRLHYLNGDRAAALLAFDGCERMLKDEVGARPSAETLALLARSSAARRYPPRSATPCRPRAAPAAPDRARCRGRPATGAGSGGGAADRRGRLGQVATAPCVPRRARRRARCCAPRRRGVPFATPARLLRAVIARGTRRCTAGAPAGHANPRSPACCRSSMPFPPPRDARRPALVMRRAARPAGARRSCTALVVDDLHFADAASLELLRPLIDEDGDNDNAAIRPLRWALAYRPSRSRLAGTRPARCPGRNRPAWPPIALAPLDAAALAALVDSLGAARRRRPPACCWGSCVAPAATRCSCWETVPAGPGWSARWIGSPMRCCCPGRSRWAG